MPSTLIDLSHTIEHGMITYKGLPAPVISDHLTREASRALYAPGTEFHIGNIEMVANTGTYLDSPYHRYKEGRDLAGLPLESLANLEGIVVRQLAGRNVSLSVRCSQTWRRVRRIYPAQRIARSQHPLWNTWT